MAVNWPGLVSIGVFYIIVLGTGIWASRKSKREEKKCSGNRSEVAMVGGRNLNIYVSIFTMTATLSNYRWALLCQTYTVEELRDPHGSISGEIRQQSVRCALHSRSHWDILWIACILGLLWLCVPFILASPSSANFTVAAVTKLHQEPWIGRLELEDAGRWVEDILLLAIGGICYQAFYQRVLSTATEAQAKITCYAAAAFCPILGIPSILIGAASEKLILMAVKVSVVLCGTAGAGLAMTTSSVHLLWIISADVLYCMMAPQVICIFYLSRWVNYLGACFGFVLALLLRVLVGEPVIGLPDLMPLPWDKIQDDGTRYRLFPFRTAILLITLGTIFLVSRLAECLFEKRKLGSEDETDATCQEMKPMNKEQTNTSLD
ncbi:hypothetical protein JOQ06_003800 [Pogonophryne albipinna]|uniref:Uncharacterized protein n=1 Tax=Pogonophryne albipinna TaxID=1090488 RepID=A0AAD6AI23_9TELE|nr:hypothetical protein JOQ06_003800 [Pogonophryne albipinna]